MPGVKYLELLRCNVFRPAQPSSPSASSYLPSSVVAMPISTHSLYPFCRGDAQQYPFLLSLLSWPCPAVPMPSIPYVVAMPSSTHSFYPFCRSDAQQYPFLLSLLSWRCPAVPIPSIHSVVAMPSSTHSFYPFCRGDAQQYPFLLSLLSWRCPAAPIPSIPSDVTMPNSTHSFYPFCVAMPSSTHSFYPFCRGDAQQHPFRLSLLSWRCPAAPIPSIPSYHRIVLLPNYSRGKVRFHLEQIATDVLPQ